MTCERNINIKEETYFFSTTGRINLLWKPLKACKKSKNVSKYTKEVVLRIRDNIQCKEGILSDVSGKKLKRNKEKKTLTKSAKFPRFVAALAQEIKKDLGWDPYQREFTRNWGNFTNNTYSRFCPTGSGHLESFQIARFEPKIVIFSAKRFVVNNNRNC